METEAGGAHNESRNTGRQSLRKTDEVIVFDLKQMEQNLRGNGNGQRVIGKEGTHFKGRRRNAA